jgi:hypothetical protein
MSDVERATERVIDEAFEWRRDYIEPEEGRSREEGHLLDALANLELARARATANRNGIPASVDAEL